jgi:hypothetical protein
VSGTLPPTVCVLAYGGTRDAGLERGKRGGDAAPYISGWVEKRSQERELLTPFLILLGLRRGTTRATGSTGTTRSTGTTGSTGSTGTTGSTGSTGTTRASRTTGASRASRASRSTGSTRSAGTTSGHTLIHQDHDHRGIIRVLHGPVLHGLKGGSVSGTHGELLVAAGDIQGAFQDHAQASHRGAAGTGGLGSLLRNDQIDTLQQVLIAVQLGVPVGGDRGDISLF